jgi:thiopeptide-type bacteriocin biosynthesis protein
MVGQIREWLQVNMSLARRSHSALPSARALLQNLEAALPSWRQQRIVSQFFFQRKPPDLRLRFRGHRESLLARLRPLLSQMKAEGHIGRSFYSVYEPEQRQFGGRECMRLVHAYWDADSMAWIALDRFIEAKTFGIPYPALMAAILNDLFWRTLHDGGEVWDTWCNVVALLQGETEGHAPSFDPPLFESLAGRASEAEVEILRRYREANETLAAGLLRAWDRGKVSSGMRSILPYVALFTLNRHGFDQPKATEVARAMATAWDPKTRLRGALPEAPTCADKRAQDAV